MTTLNARVPLWDFLSLNATGGDGYVVIASPGAELLWPGSIPDSRYFPMARFTGLEAWLAEAPVMARPLFCERVLHKQKPVPKDFAGFVKCEELFEFYALCNSAGRSEFGKLVVPVETTSSVGVAPRRIVLPSCIPPGEKFKTATYLGMRDFLTFCSADTAATVKKECYGSGDPTDVRLEGPVSVVSINVLYNLMPSDDKMLFRASVQLKDPPQRVGVADGPPIGEPDKVPLPPDPEVPKPLPPVPLDPFEPSEAGLPVVVAPGGGYPVPLGVPAGVQFPHDLPAVPAVDGDPVEACLELARGHCYGNLFVEGAVGRAIERLEFNPWGPQLVSYLMADYGCWSPDRFTLTIGGSRLDKGGTAYFQAHVEKCEHGLRVRELLPFLNQSVRVGMSSNLNALMALQEETVSGDTATVFDIKPSSSGMRLTLGLSARLGNGHLNFSWNVFSTPTLALMLGMYESVRIEELDFVAVVSPGVDNTLWAAVTSSGVVLNGTDAWLAAPIMTTINGSESGVVKGSFGLPERHQFSREIRNQGLGNASPTFHFNYQGATGSHARLSGRLVVTVSGQAVMGHVNINTAPHGKATVNSIVRDAAQIVNTLGYPTVFKESSLDSADCYEDDDGDGQKHAG